VVTIPSFLQVQDEDEAYEKWLKEQTKAYESFKNEQDSLFSDWLKKEWQAFEVFKGLVREVKPKPQKPPVAKHSQATVDLFQNSLRQSKPVESIPLVEIKSQPRPSLIYSPAGEKKTGYKICLVPFFDDTISFSYDPKFSTKLYGPLNNRTIADYWDKAAKADYEYTVNELQFLKKQLNLNDWGYLLLINQVGKAIYPSSPVLVNLFDWFVALKSGYNIRIGYTEDRIYLLLTSQQIIYNVSYFSLEGKNYYLVNLSAGIPIAGSIYTYDHNYPDAKTLTNLYIDKSPGLRDALFRRSFTFHYNGTEYQVPVNYNKNVIDFYTNYPVTDLDVYFDASVSSETGYSLLSALKPLIANKSEVEAVNLILRFVQTVFEYKTDEEQFGREKYLFHEETLYYASSDCEDRSILFSYLVKNLTGLEIVGLDYPGHISTAVRFNTEVSGDSVVFEGNKFIICDPTYINADVGMAMPMFKDTTPKIIRLNVPTLSQL
jgi:hypothetical protein